MRAEPLAQQEVAIAVHECARARPSAVSVCERGDDRRDARVVVVVADPGLEQIAEDVQLARRRAPGRR